MISSPCIGLCRLDPATQLCGGCARTGAEIAAWKDADPADRAQTWAALPRRRAALGIGLHRLAWTPGEILNFVEITLGVGRGSWTVGPPGASAPLALGGEVVCRVDRAAATVTGLSVGAALRFTITDRVRALALPLAPGGHASARGRVALAVPRGREASSSALGRGLTPLGPDRDAIQPEDRGARLYDLGFAAAAGRVCLRTGDCALIAELDRRAGQGGGELLRDLAGPLAEAAPRLVVVTPMARVEVGPAPDLLASGREVAPGLAIPEAFVPCAWFDPIPPFS